MKKILFMLLAAVSVTVRAEVEPFGFTFFLADGTQYVFKEGDRPELLWEGDSLFITTKTAQVGVLRTAFKGISPGGGDPMSVKNVTGGNSRVSWNAKGQLTVEGLPQGSAVSVYDASGRLCQQRVSVANGRLSLKMSGLRSGTYFVKIDNQPTIKIMLP